LEKFRAAFLGVIPKGNEKTHPGVPFHPFARNFFGLGLGAAPNAIEFSSPGIAENLCPKRT
jgi:hypothetical protein